jgi:ribose 1,5-bisphosphokinase PhnN
MLRYNLTMEVNENLRVCAHHPLVLLSRVQLATIDTATEQGATLILTVSTLIVADRPTRGAE